MPQVIETPPMQNRHDPEMRVRWLLPEVPPVRTGVSIKFRRYLLASKLYIMLRHSCKRAKIRLDYEQTCFTSQSELLLFGDVTTRRRVDNEVERTCDTPLTFDL